MNLIFYTSGLLHGGPEALNGFSDCDADDIEAKLNNFKELNRTLRKLGCPLGRTEVKAVVVEQRGVASALLLSIKKVSEGRPLRAPKRTDGRSFDAPLKRFANGTLRVSTFTC